MAPIKSRFSALLIIKATSALSLVAVNRRVNNSLSGSLCHALKVAGGSLTSTSGGCGDSKGSRSPAAAGNSERGLDESDDEEEDGFGAGESGSSGNTSSAEEALDDPAGQALKEDMTDPHFLRKNLLYMMNFNSGIKNFEEINPSTAYKHLVHLSAFCLNRRNFEDALDGESWPTPGPQHESSGNDAQYYAKDPGDQKSPIPLAPGKDPDTTGARSKGQKTAKKMDSSVRNVIWFVVPGAGYTLGDAPRFLKNNFASSPRTSMQWTRVKSDISVWYNHFRRSYTHFRLVANIWTASVGKKLKKLVTLEVADPESSRPWEREFGWNWRASPAVDRDNQRLVTRIYDQLFHHDGKSLDESFIIVRQPRGLNGGAWFWFNHHVAVPEMILDYHCGAEVSIEMDTRSEFSSLVSERSEKRPERSEKRLKRRSEKRLKRHGLGSLYTEAKLNGEYPIHCWQKGGPFTLRVGPLFVAPCQVNQDDAVDRWLATQNPEIMRDHYQFSGADPHDRNYVRHEVAKNGDCMYTAISQALEHAGERRRSVEELRRMVFDHAEKVGRSLGWTTEQVKGTKRRTRGGLLKFREKNLARGTNQLKLEYWGGQAELLVLEKELGIRIRILDAVSKTNGLLTEDNTAQIEIVLLHTPSHYEWCSSEFTSSRFLRSLNAWGTRVVEGQKSRVFVFHVGVATRNIQTMTTCRGDPDIDMIMSEIMRRAHTLLRQSPRNRVLVLGGCGLPSRWDGKQERFAYRKGSSISESFDSYSYMSDPLEWLSLDLKKEKELVELETAQASLALLAPASGEDEELGNKDRENRIQVTDRLVILDQVVLGQLVGQARPDFAVQAGPDILSMIGKFALGPKPKRLIFLNESLVKEALFPSAIAAVQNFLEERDDGNVLGPLIMSFLLPQKPHFEKLDHSTCARAMKWYTQAMKTPFPFLSLHGTSLEQALLDSTVVQVQSRDPRVAREMAALDGLLNPVFSGNANSDLIKFLDSSCVEMMVVPLEGRGSVAQYEFAMRRGLPVDMVLPVPKSSSSWSESSSSSSSDSYGDLSSLEHHGLAIGLGDEKKLLGEQFLDSEDARAKKAAEDLQQIAAGRRMLGRKVSNLNIT